MIATLLGAGVTLGHAAAQEAAEPPADAAPPSAAAADAPPVADAPSDVVPEASAAPGEPEAPSGAASGDAPGPQPTAAEPATPQGPDPVFADWGEPGAGVPPEPPPPVQVALMLGLGAALDDEAGSVNPLGVGIGSRASYLVLPELVVGARFMYFFGGSTALPTGKLSMTSWNLAADAAVVVPLAYAIDLEPGILLGVNSLTVKGRSMAFLEGEGSGFVGGSVDGTEYALYVAPGAALRVGIEPFPGFKGLFAGADVRLGLMFRDLVSASIEIMGQAGLRF